MAIITDILSLSILNDLINEEKNVQCECWMFRLNTQYPKQVANDDDDDDEHRCERV